MRGVLPPGRPSLRSLSPPPQRPRTRPSESGQPTASLGDLPRGASSPSQASGSPKLEKVVGSDGKAYPRNRVSELEDEARYHKERRRAEIRRALVDPIKRYRSDAGIAEDLDVGQEEVAEQRRDLRENGLRMGDLYVSREEPEPGTPEHKERQEQRRRQIEAQLPKKAKDAVYRLWLTWHRTDPEKAAGLSQDTFEQLLDPQAQEGLATAREVRDWLDRYIRALERLNKPGVRAVK